jgi:hypothetical protein
MVGYKIPLQKRPKGNRPYVFGIAPSRPTPGWRNLGSERVAQKRGRDRVSDLARRRSERNAHRYRGLGTRRVNSITSYRGMTTRGLSTGQRHMHVTKFVSAPYRERMVRLDKPMGEWSALPSAGPNHRLGRDTIAELRWVDRAWPYLGTRA